ncbi:unnamed protein product [Rhizoctonia solani]|uniref:Uncharacterized protein n=2 Tax=Rhizoctonia solani TaxID=456999 RepID=A0A8H3AQN2_9AGAM|nr:hypothetical protein RSOL_471130 [Rhizoctonia solani AG-3 Rhs1AP]CAE6433540.1 unnamed protein product [Rhizoctonia solani]CAE6504364.1 unnamed protein product [Rhizoctonia solani]
MGYHHYSFAFTGNSQGNGSSKLFWFVLGGVAVTAWFKIKERREISGCKRRRVSHVDVETTEAAMDVADATLDAAIRIVETLKQTLQEQRSHVEHTRNRATHAGPQLPRAEQSRSRSPSSMAGFHQVEDTS